MKFIIYTFIIALFNSAQAEIENSPKQMELKPFVTDYCTMFFDGTPNEPTLWRHCCIMHDMKYWYGGDQSDMDRADLALKSCVSRVAGYIWGDLIYSGVRMGHKSPVKNNYRWSWGWVRPRPKTKLSEEEKDYVIDELLKLPFPAEYVEQVIHEYFGNEI